MLFKNRFNRAISFAVFIVSIMLLASFAATLDVHARDSVLSVSQGKLDVNSEDKAAFAPGELLVKFDTTDANSISSLLKGLNAEIIDYYQYADVYHVRISGQMPTSVVLGDLRKNAQIQYAEPNYIRKVSLAPNDPFFGNQWGLRNVGQFGGTPGADISALKAWDTTTGSSATVVAVIDTGVDYTHPDLAGNMWRNPGEIPGNGIDDDHNGYVDDVYGIDAVNLDSNPIDDFGHGTHVAGIIGAVGNNGIGVTGVNWNVRIMALKFLDSSGSGYDSGAIACINYAIMMKAVYGINVRILSASWGGVGYDQALSDAISAAGSNDMLFVAAAGNSASNNDVMPFYPSSYNLDNLISVAATDYNDQLASFSSYGPGSVDVAEPGYHIFSTMPTYFVTMNTFGYNMNYDYLSGTSMACPHGAGVAALILAANPAYTYAQVRTRILSTVDVLPSLSSMVFTNGRINASRAITPNDNSMHLNINFPIVGFTLLGGVSYNIAAWVHTVTDPILGAQVQASFSTGEPPLTLRDDGVAPDNVANDGIYTAAYAPYIPGAFTVTVDASGTGFTPTSSSVSGNVIFKPRYAAVSSAYQWVEISGSSAGMFLGDDSAITVSLPFAISFYDDSYPDLTIGSNGNLNFENMYLGTANTPIPSRNVYDVNRLIGVFWTDLNMQTSINHGAVYCGVLGSFPNRFLVVEWSNVAGYFNVGSATFEIIFYENNSDILLQYQDVFFGNSFYDYGQSATVGIQYNPDWGTQVSYNTPSLHNNYALRLTTGVIPLQSIASAIIQDPAQSAYYVRTGNIYDDSALGFVYGKSTNPQNIIPCQDPTYVNQATGMPLFLGDTVAFGGRLANSVTRYYEDQHLARVGFDQNSTHYLFKLTATGQVVYAVNRSTYAPGLKDYFIIQAFTDGSRKVLTMWGLNYQGTYASGLCFADIVWPNISSFGNSYYIYVWQDLNGDGLQTTNEITLQTSGI